MVFFISVNTGAGRKNAVSFGKRRLTVFAGTGRRLIFKANTRACSDGIETREC